MRTGRMTLQELTIALVMAGDGRRLDHAGRGVRAGDDRALRGGGAVRDSRRALEGRRGLRQLGPDSDVRRRDLSGRRAQPPGAAAWLAQETIARWATGPVSVVAMISGMSIVLTVLMSNSPRSRW